VIAYLTDVEGRWDKLETFAEDNPLISLDGDRLRLAEGVTFVFGGDAIDRGPHGRRVVRTLLAAKRQYGERVVLLAGNRDINKLRLWREIGTAPGRPERLREIFARTMGAKDAFAHRQAELAEEGPAAGDEDVVESFLEDLAAGGELRAYLEACRLAYRSGATLFVHGAVTAENLGGVPERDERIDDVDAWARALDALYAEQLHAFASGRDPTTLVAYQAPIPGTSANQASVVYGRTTDAIANPLAPPVDVVRRLRENGVHRIVVGHTPSGDCPAIVRDGDFEVVLADNAYGRIERGSQVAITDDETVVAGVTRLDDGTDRDVRFTSARADVRSPLGKRDASSGELVKARLDGGDHLLFAGLPERRVRQRAASPDDAAQRTWVTPR